MNIKISLLKPGSVTNIEGVVECTEIEQICHNITNYSWTPAQFKDGYRNKANAVETQLIALDFDDGMTLDEAKKAFEGYWHVIGTTRNHQKDKGGVVCDRFRVLLLLDNPVTTNATYRATYESLMQQFPTLDPSCKDISRFLYPCVEIVSTNDFDLGTVEPVEAEEQEEKTFERPEGDVKGRLNGSTEDFFSRGAPEGHRNTALTSAVYDCIEQGYSKDEVEDRVRICGKFNGIENFYPVIHSKHQATIDRLFETHVPTNELRDADVIEMPMQIGQVVDDTAMPQAHMTANAVMPANAAVPQANVPANAVMPQANMPANAVMPQANMPANAVMPQANMPANAVETFDPSASIAVVDLIKPAKDFLSDERKVAGDSTGISGLDDLLGGGFRDGELTVLQGEAKTGKNTLWHQIQYHLLSRGIAQGYASREIDPAEEVVPNLISLHLKKNAWKDKLTQEDWDKAREWASEIPLHFTNDYGPMPWEELEAWMNRLLEKGVKSFWIDHLHYILDQEDHTKAALLVRNIKTYAKRNKVHINLIVQPTKLGIDQRLGLGSLRGGAAIGQALDNLLLFEREKTNDVRHITRLTLAQARSKVARTGNIFMKYDPKTTEMIEVEWQEDSQGGGNTPQGFMNGPSNAMSFDTFDQFKQNGGGQFAQ